MKTKLRYFFRHTTSPLSLPRGFLCYVLLRMVRTISFVLFSFSNIIIFPTTIQNPSLFPLYHCLLVSAAEYSILLAHLSRIKKERKNLPLLRSRERVHACGFVPRFPTYFCSSSLGCRRRFRLLPEPWRLLLLLGIKVHSMMPRPFWLTRRPMWCFPMLMLALITITNG